MALNRPDSKLLKMPLFNISFSKFKMMDKKLYWFTFVGLVILYVAITFIAPTDPHILEKYHITQTGARLLNLTIVVPLTTIWLVAYYGFSKMKSYALSLGNAPDGAPFRAIANGLMIAVMALPLTAAVSAGLNYLVVRNPALLPTTTILRNYLNMVLAVGAFYLIGKGAEELARLVKGKSNSFDHQAWSIGLIIISSLFSWLVLSHHATGSVKGAVYFLPDWLVILTIVVPYLYVWYRGMRVAYYIYFYQTKVKGVIYKRALSYFSAGIGVVIVASVFIQFLTVFGERLNRLNLTPILLVVYVLLCLYAVGYGLIAKGAKRLKIIEEA